MEEEKRLSATRTSRGDDNNSDNEEDQGKTALFEKNKRVKNSQMAVGSSHNRAFIVRGSDIGVFRYTDDDRGVQYVNAIENIRTPNGDLFSPSRVMLHEQDSSMILMRANDEHRLYKMDMERGKVVEEWKVHDVLPINDVCPDSKYAPKTATKTFVGINSNSIFRVDPRLAGEKLVADECKQYVSRSDFSCAATTGRGGIGCG